MRRCLLLLTGLAVLATGCSDSTTASRLTDGTFLLRTVAGEPLPARMRIDQFGGVYLADTLRFAPIRRPRFSEPRVERSIVERLPGGEIVNPIEFVAYHRDGNDFTFYYPCPADADCMIGLASGRLSGDRLEVTTHPNSGLRSPLMYERIR